MSSKLLKRFSVFSLATTLCLGNILAAGSNVAFALDLQGKVDTTHAQDGAGNNVIQGGIKDEATLEPSLKVIPGQVRKQGSAGQLQSEVPQYFFPSGAKLTQYRGGTQVPNPYSAPGRYTAQTPSLDVQQFSGNRGPHYIAPISSYTLLPQRAVQSYHTSGYSATSSIRGVTSYVPGYEVTKVDTHKGITAYAPGHAAQQPAVAQKGVATYSPGYSFEFTRLTPLGGLAHGGARPVPGPVAREGVTAYAPGYQTISVPVTTHSGTSVSTPGHSSYTPGSTSTSTQQHPGYQITIKTPKNGIVCWDSNYETTTVHNGLIKNTLGGMWFHGSPSEHVTPETERGPGTSELPFKPMFAVPVVDLPGKSLQAQALGLPGVHPVAATAPELSWDEWYKRVARAVYRRWQNADVGPGHATVAVTVNKDRSLSGRVVDFTPAVGVERDVDEETGFKRAALDAVNLVSEFEIPPFPPSANDAPSVTFDIEMKREVDGPSGFDVASTTPQKGAPSPEGSSRTAADGADAASETEALQIESPDGTSSKTPAKTSTPTKGSKPKPKAKSKRH
jgi:hypothetical protein